MLEGLEVAKGAFPTFPKREPGRAVDILLPGIEPGLEFAEVLQPVAVGVAPSPIVACGIGGVETVGLLPVVWQIVIIAIPGALAVRGEELRPDDRLGHAGPVRPQPGDAGMVRRLVFLPGAALEQHLDVIPPRP